MVLHSILVLDYVIGVDEWAREAVFVHHDSPAPYRPRSMSVAHVNNCMSFLRIIGQQINWLGVWGLAIPDLSKVVVSINKYYRGN